VVSSRSTDARSENEVVRGKEGEGLAWEPKSVPMIEDYRAVMAQRAVFQSVASMGLPAFTIHSIVRYSGKALRDAKNTTIRSWGPIGVCLFLPSYPRFLVILAWLHQFTMEELAGRVAAVPFLPFIFDKPVEQAVEWGFHKGFETIWGPEAVRQRPVTGRIEELQAESKKAAGKEKEL